MKKYKFNIVNFSDETDTKLDETTNKDQTDGSNDSNKDDTITLTSKQLKERLEREKQKYQKEQDTVFQEKLKLAVANALKENEQKAQKEKDFSKLSEEEKEKELLRRKIEELEVENQKNQESFKQYENEKRKNQLITEYTKDGLPKADEFSVVAEVLSTIPEEKQLEVYKALKTIIDFTKSDAIQGNFKQRTPNVGGQSGSSSRASEFHAKQKEKMKNTSKDPWK